MRRKDANDVQAGGTDQKDAPEAATEQGSDDCATNVNLQPATNNCDGPKVVVTMKNIPEAVAAAEEASRRTTIHQGCFTATENWSP